MEYSHCPWIDDPSQPVLPQFGRNVYIGAVRTELKKRGCTCIEDQGEYVNRECTYTDSNNDGNTERQRDDDDGKEADIATRSSFRGGVGISIYVNI